MMLSNAQQLLPLFHGLGIGVWAGIVYALLGVGVHPRRRAARRRFFGDMLLSLATGTLLFLSSLATTGGELRLSALLAVFVGAVAAHQTVGRLIVAVVRATLHMLRKVDAIWRQFARQIGRFLRNSLKKALFFSKKGLRTAFYMLYNKKRT